MNVNGVGASLQAFVSAGHRSQNAAGFREEPKPGADPAGKSANSPAFTARALIAGDPTLGDERFGKVVSRVARGELPEPTAPAPVDPPPATETDPATVTA